MTEYITTGGPLMWAIIGLGALALCVYLERSFHIHRARINWEDFLKGLFNVVDRDHIDEALSICEDTPGPVAHLARVAIVNRDESGDIIRAAMQAAGESEISRMRRRFVLIATAGQVAPLIGLLGTIFKMVEGIMNIQSQTPLVQSIDILDPLMQALVMAAAGLTVAIPCYLAYNLLVVKVERIVVDMHVSATEILRAMNSGRRTDGDQVEGTP